MEGRKLVIAVRGGWSGRSRPIHTIQIEQSGGSCLQLGGAYEEFPSFLPVFGSVTFVPTTTSLVSYKVTQVLSTPHAKTTRSHASWVVPRTGADTAGPE